MTYDWAMLEALEEVDAIGWAAPPVAPAKRDPGNTGIAMMQLINEPIEVRATRDRANRDWVSMVLKP